MSGPASAERHVAGVGVYKDAYTRARASFINEKVGSVTARFIVWTKMKDEDSAFSVTIFLLFRG